MVKVALALLLLLSLPLSLAHAEPTVVYCPPMQSIVGNYHFNPQLRLYQSQVEQNGELYVGGFGFTANNTARVVVKQVGGSMGYVFTFNTDRNGTFLEGIRIGTNINQTTQRVYGVDAATKVKTNNSTVNVIPSSTLTPVLNGRHFTWQFHHVDWYAANQQEVDSLAQFVDNAYDQYARDFGFGIGQFNVQVSNELDNMTRLYVGFASGTTIGLSANLLTNDYLARSFLSHEMANIFQGNVTGGWPWADGKGVWRQLSKRGEVASPYPYVASARVLQELGYGNYSQRKLDKASGDCGVSLLWVVYERFGWTPYISLFSYLRQLHVNLADYDENAKNAVIMVLMSAGTGYDFINLFNETFTMRGVGISQEAINSAYGKFQNLPSITNLQNTGVVVVNEVTPIPEYPAPILIFAVAIVLCGLAYGSRRSLTKPHLNNGGGYCYRAKLVSDCD